MKLLKILLLGFLLVGCSPGEVGGVANGPAPEETFPSGITSAATIPNVVKVVAGYRHACAVTEANGVYCWGANSHGQLLLEEDIKSSATPLAAPIAGIEKIALGYGRTCGVSGEKVFCWGRTGAKNGFPVSPFPREITGFPPGVERLYVGTVIDCALLRNQQAICWLEYENESTGRNENVYLLPSTEVTGIAIGPLHGCTFNKRTVSCFGYRAPNLGQEYWKSGYKGWYTGEVTSVNGVSAAVLALHSTTFSDEVVEVLATITSTCARLSNDQVYCWGSNTIGLVGTGNEDINYDIGIPQFVGTTASLKGSSRTICLRNEASLMECFGARVWEDNKACDETHAPEKFCFDSHPQPVPQLVDDFEIGGNFVCLYGDGKPITCMGRNADGQLGLGEEEDVDEYERETLEPPVWESPKQSGDSVH